MSVENIAVIGSGSTGAAIAHDLASRGFNVTLFERGGIIGGTSGKFHGLLHSGARYAVKDVKAAKESIEDNYVISKIAPHCIEDTGGLFVALDGDDLDYADQFEKGCKESNIPIQQVDISKLKDEEPFLSKNIKVAFRVPDKIINSFKFITSLLLTAKSEGAKIRLNSEVLDFITDGKQVKGLKVKNNVTGKVETYNSDLIINASGPWAVGILSKLGIESIKLLLSAGTMVVLNRRFTKAVVNRLRIPSDGDIVVPYFTESIIGTTSFIVADPDNFEIDEDDVKFLVEEGSKLIPEIKNYPVLRYYAGVRPLVASSEDDTGRSATRDFKIYDHEADDGVSGIITIVGGKLSTARLMGKQIGDFVSNKLGKNTVSNTDKIKLLWPDLNENNIEEISKSTGIDAGLIREFLFETKDKIYEDIYNPMRDLIISRMLF